jgi:hypothetical protein
VNNTTHSSGGGIANHGDLTVERSFVYGNQATGPFGTGGGIYNGSADSQLTVVNSSVEYNDAAAEGGGIGVHRGLVTLIHVLVRANFAGLRQVPNGPGGELGGGIWLDDDGGSVFLKNSLVVYNERAGYGSDECGPNPILSGDYNLITRPSQCTLTGQTAHVNASDLEIPLGGGSSGGFAFIPTNGAPWADTIPLASCTDPFGAPLLEDGRGFGRYDGACDVGPYELYAQYEPPVLLGAELVRNGGALGNELGLAAPDAGIDPDGLFTAPYWAGSLVQVLYGAPGFPTGAPDHTPPGSGHYLFTGGRNAQSTAFQVFDVSALASEIDAGQVGFTVSGAFGGYGVEDDRARLDVEFRNPDAGLLERRVLGDFGAAARGYQTKLIRDSERGVVPPGTRFVQLRLEAVRTHFLYNDGYADDISIMLPEPAPFPLGAVAIATVALLARPPRAFASRVRAIREDADPTG